MAAFDNLVGKAQAFLKDEKVQDKLHGAKTEEVSDRILNAAEDAVNRVTGNTFSKQLAGAKDAADKAIGAKEPTDRPAPAKAAGEPAGGSNLVGDLARGTKPPSEK